MLKKTLFFCLVATSYCGVVNDQKYGKVFPDGRIVGGTDADITEFPHQVSLTFSESHHCGGSIIGNNVVLCAAHCVREEFIKYYKILSGSSNLESGDEHNVTKVHIHPKYGFDTQDYDISLIEVDPPFKFSNTTRKIELSKDEPKDGIVTATGWGITHSGDFNFPKHLQKVSVPVVPHEECNTDYNVTGREVTDRMWCAGEKDKDSCSGDSGGPVVQNGKLVGIVSWGNGCGLEGFPGVYTNVANEELQKFIADNIPNL